MQKKGLRFYSLFATMLFVLPVFLQLAKIGLGYEKLLSYIIYALVGVSFIYNLVDTKKRVPYARAFIFDNSYHLNVFSYLVAVGFFVEFITNVAIIVRYIIYGTTVIITYFVPVVACALFALLSCFYFIVVGSSFGKRNYDFRSFKMFHIVVLLWAISKLMTLFGQAIQIQYDVNGVLRYLSIMVLSFFFYHFVYEIESEAGARWQLVYFARMSAYCSGLYCIDRLIMIIANEAKLNSYNSYFAIMMLFVCLFSLFFEKNILHNSKEEE